MEYSDQAILALADALDENQQSYDWLLNNNCRELAALTDVLCTENEEALAFLLSGREKFSLVIDFLAALQKQHQAFQHLMSTHHPQWAAIVSAYLNDEEAYAWLQKNGFSACTELADSLMRNFPSKSRSGGIGSFSGGGSSGGGGGFSGFGGGSFGGGGGGGKW